MRLFVALPVPDPVRERLAAAIDGLPERYPGLRWTRPDGWHVTLAFLGQVAADRVDEVSAVVARVTGEVPTTSPTLALAEPGRFGRSVAWLGVADEPLGAVAGLGERLQEALAAAGLAGEPRPVHPHLTLARTRRGGRLPRHLLDDLPRVEATWRVEEAVTYRSQLGPGGSVYEPVGRSPW